MMNRAKVSTPKATTTPKSTQATAKNATPSPKPSVASGRRSVAATPKTPSLVHPLEQRTGSATPKLSKPKKRMVEEVSSDDEVYGLGDVAPEDSDEGEQIYVDDFEKDPNIQLMLVTIPPGIDINSLIGKTVSEKRKKYSLKARKANSSEVVQDRYQLQILKPNQELQKWCVFFPSKADKKYRYAGRTLEGTVAVTPVTESFVPEDNLNDFHDTTAE
ncbi:hypothetical protein RvY_02487 [Ramazzottius varieornatus]|uniref:Uncharacterized protein n=1 Tax=Ramazzottius varieornatus TaxID=947166 RepID=A0A1D1UNM6_RAMVA|nr:hypothetical protein RvY_02487 [Ramazzottius varieornatus]